MIGRICKSCRAIPKSAVWLLSALLMVVTPAITATHAHAQQPDLVLHVDIVNGSTSGDGLSWNTATRFLQDALTMADDHHDTFPSHLIDIWVAAGTYVPDQDKVTVPNPGLCSPQHCFGDGDREKSFELRDNVRILGGFDGTEDFEHERCWLTNITILSGDLKYDDDFQVHTVVVDDVIVSLGFTFDNYDDNSQHVVTASNVGSNAVLDGFIIQGGYGDPDCAPQCNGSEVGSAMLVANAGPTVRNCVFRRNFNPPGDHNSLGGGLGVFNGYVEHVPTFVNCVFKHNSAQEGSGIGVVSAVAVDFIGCTIELNSGPVAAGAYRGLEEGTITFVNSIFRDNFSAGGAAGLYIANRHGKDRLWNCLFYNNRNSDGAGAIRASLLSNVEIVNCTIADNFGYGAAGGVESVTNVGVTILNSIIWFNTGGEVAGNNLTIDRSNVQGGWTGDNDDADPEFIDRVSGDYRLASNSPSINKGDIGWVPCNEYWAILGFGGCLEVACDSDELIPVDLDWEPRVSDCVEEEVDQGAYEHIPS